MVSPICLKFGRFVALVVYDFLVEFQIFKLNVLSKGPLKAAPWRNEGTTTADGRATGDGRTTGDGKTTVGGKSTGDGNSGGGVESVWSYVGAVNFTDVKIRGVSMGLIIRWRGQTDCLRIGRFPQTAADDDIVDVTCRSVEKSARLTSLANRTGDLVQTGGEVDEIDVGGR